MHLVVGTPMYGGMCCSEYTQSMLQYAHTGAHQQAIAAAYKHNFFSESMFARMRVLRRHGEWPRMMVTPHAVEETLHG